MPYDFSELSISTFPGINAQPIPPSASRGGNGSHLISQFNELVDETVSALNDLESRVNDIDSNTPLTSERLLTENMTWYVDPINGNDDNNGTSVETAFLSLQKAATVAASYTNKSFYSRIIRLLDGTHYGVQLPTFMSNSSSDLIHLQGNVSDPSAVQLGGFATVNVFGNGIYRLDYLTLNENEGNGYCIFADNARIQIGEVYFGSTFASHVAGVNHSLIEVVGNYSIRGNANEAHIYLDSFSHLNMNPHNASRTIELNGDWNIGIFALLKRGSCLSAKNTSFNGRSFGQKFSVETNAIIDTDTGNLDLLPGDTSGILAKNGQYF